MDTAPPVTSYAISYNATPRTVTVTQPNGVKSKQTSYNAPGQWNDGLIYQDETLDAANIQLNKSIVTWGQGAYDSSRPTQTEITDEKGQVLKTTYTYGTNYNQLTSQKEYDYDGTTLLKETRTSFENSSLYTNRHIFNLVKTSEIFDGAETRVARTDYEYDNNAVVNGTQSLNLKETPNVTMHYSTYDPYTTETEEGCAAYIFNYPQCSYEGEIIFVGEYPYEQYQDVCVGTCTEPFTYSVYDSNTAFRGNLTKTTGYADAQSLTNSITQTSQYDVTGNLVAESASCCEIRTYEYTIATQYAYPTSASRGSSDLNSPIRNTTSSIYDFYTGLIKTATDENGRTDSTTYNTDTLRPIQSNSSTGSYTQAFYDDVAMTITNEVHETNGNLARKRIQYLNGIGKVKREDALGSNNIWDIVETKYTNLNQVWKQSRPYRASETVYWTENVYDALGRTKQVIEPDGSISQAFYNETNRPSSASTLAGNTVRAIDAWGRERWGRTDAQEKLVEVVEPNPNDNGSISATGSLVTKYIYSTLGKLIQTTQGDQNRYFKYDSLGRLIRQKMAEQSPTLNDAGQYVGNGIWSDAFFYDNRSNLVQKVDARGVKSNYSYQLNGAGDPLNRIQVVSYDTSGPTDTSKPILPAAPVTYEYMAAGDKDRIKKVTSVGVSTEEYFYDVEGRVTDYTQTLLNRPSYPMTTSYLYDVLNRTTEIRYPAQYGMAGNPRKVIIPTYDTGSRLANLNVDGQTQASNIVYNASDQTTSINIGAAGANQVNEQYTFDQQTGLLTNQKAIRNGQTLLDLSYDYNRNNSTGNTNGKTSALTKIINNLDQNKNREYQYDALGRLVTAKGGATSNLWQQQYTYDRYGNRTNVTASGVAANNTPIPMDGIPNLAFNTQTNRITTANFEYDVSGNQTKSLAEDGVNWLKFEYDAANRLVNIKQDNGNLVQSFNYGDGRERISASDYVISQTTYYSENSVEYIENGNSGVLNWSKIYVYLGDRLLSTITPNGGSESTEYNHPDRLGTRLITNQNGSYEQVNLPFGTGLGAESTGSTSKRFTSYDRSVITGLDYAVNRTYDSKQGRFTQIDPIGMEAVNLQLPQTLNLFNYCGNDPVNHTDPNGLFWGAIGRFFKKIGNFLSKVAYAVSKVLNNRWVRIGVFILGFILPGIQALSALAAKIVTTALNIYNKIAEIVSIIEMTGQLLTANFKQFGITVGFAFLSAAISPLVEGAVGGAQGAIFGKILGKTQAQDLAGVFKGIAGGIKGRWKDFTHNLFGRGLLGIVPGLDRFAGPNVPDDNTLDQYNGYHSDIDTDQNSYHRHDIDSVRANRVPRICKQSNSGFKNYLKLHGDLRLLKNLVFSSPGIRLTDIAFARRPGVGSVYHFLALGYFSGSATVRAIRRR